MLAQFPSSYPLKQVRADLMLKMSKPQESEKILDDLSKARPLDPDVWNRLAEVRSLTNNAIGVHQAPSTCSDRRLPGRHRAARFRQRRAGGNFQLAARLDARQQEIRQQEKMVKKCSAERRIRGKTPGDARRNRGLGEQPHRAYSPLRGRPRQVQAFPAWRRRAAWVKSSMRLSGPPAGSTPGRRRFPAALAQAGQGPLERVHRHPRAVRATAAGGAVAGGGASMKSFSGHSCCIL